MLAGTAIARVRRAQGAGIAASAGPSGPASVTPAGTVLRLRDHGADEDVYLLALVATPVRAWLSVAARTDEPPPGRRTMPLRQPGRTAGGAGSRRPAQRPAAFARAAMTAVDSAGQRYGLTFSGSGGTWYLGRLALSPAPPPGITWLEVSWAGHSARIDLTARPPDAELSVHPASAGPGEAYLRQRAEMLLDHPALAPAEAPAMAAVVPALRAAGLLAADSPMPGQVAALLQWLGAPGRIVAGPAGDLPPRWASVLEATWPDGHRRHTSARGRRVAAAHLTAAAPEADGIAVTLAGLATWADGGTVVFGALHPRPDAAGETSAAPSLWLRDDSGHWHSVSISGWSSDGSKSGSYPFQAEVVPPLPPTTVAVEFFVTGPTAEVRAAIPLTWWRT